MVAIHFINVHYIDTVDRFWMKIRLLKGPALQIWFIFQICSFSKISKQNWLTHLFFPCSCQEFSSSLTRQVFPKQKYGSFYLPSWMWTVTLTSLALAGWQLYFPESEGATESIKRWDLGVWPEVFVSTEIPPRGLL